MPGCDLNFDNFLEGLRKLVSFRILFYFYFFVMFVLYFKNKDWLFIFICIFNVITVCSVKWKHQLFGSKATFRI